MAGRTTTTTTTETPAMPILSAAFMRTARTLYLYSDGHGVVLHEKKDRDAGTVEWITLHQTFGPKVRTTEKELATYGSIVSGKRLSHGRLIVKREAMPMVAMAKRLSWTDYLVEHGSQTSKERGIRYADIALDFIGEDYASAHIPVLDCICGDFTPQMDEKWSARFEDHASKHHWSGHRIKQVIRDTPEAAAA